tara:strand:- start:195 stop:710 length:516 start_codon:yes stop_codon:yes gene_type:complete
MNDREAEAKEVVRDVMSAAYFVDQLRSRLSSPNLGTLIRALVGVLTLQVVLSEAANRAGFPVNSAGKFNMNGMSADEKEELVSKLVAAMGDDSMKDTVKKAAHAASTGMEMFYGIIALSPDRFLAAMQQPLDEIIDRERMMDDKEVPQDAQDKARQSLSEILEAARRDNDA